MYTKFFENQVSSFNWVPLLEALLQYKTQRPNKSFPITKIINIFINEAPLSNDLHLNNEFEFGIHDLGYSNITKNNEVVKVLRLLFCTAYFFQIQLFTKADYDLVSALISTLKTTNIGDVIYNQLSRINSMSDISDYDNYQDCGLSGFYGSMEKNGWACCCDLFLPAFDELINNQNVQLKI